MTKSRDVLGQAGGYFLQETRFLYHLLKARTGDAVSLEYLGDVITAHGDGSVTTEEDKSSIKDNPVTDRSVNLWKTLHNWILLAENGDLDPVRTQYVLYVPHKEFSGAFIKKFNDARDEKAAIEALDYVEKTLWGRGPKYELKAQLADSIAKYVEKVFSNITLSAKILSNFTYERGAEAGYEELKALIKDTQVPPEHADAYRKHFLGWIKERIDLCIAGGIVPIISRDEFIAEGHSILRKFNREGILRSAYARPTDETVDEHIKKSPTYIRQLEFINLVYEDKLNAVCDYLMAEDDRYTWITHGILHESSADEFDNRLKTAWKNICGEVKATTIHDDLERQGAAVYYKCCQYTTRIENSEVPAHLVPGTYHLLADEPSLGWHPNWSQLLSDEPEEDES